MSDGDELSASSDDTWADHVRRDAMALRLTEPPPLLKQRLRSMMSRAGAEQSDTRAALVSDTRWEELQVGVRAADLAAESRYQLSYRSEPVDIVLDIAEQDPTTVDIRGQVLAGPEHLPVFEATVYWPDGALRTILGDDLGGFILLGVPTTAHTLVVTNDQVRVQMHLELEAGRQ